MKELIDIIKYSEARYEAKSGLTDLEYMKKVINQVAVHKPSQLPRVIIELYDNYLKSKIDYIKSEEFLKRNCDEVIKRSKED